MKRSLIYITILLALVIGISAFAYNAFSDSFRQPDRLGSPLGAQDAQSGPGAQSKVGAQDAQEATTVTAAKDSAGDSGSAPNESDSSAPDAQATQAKPGKQAVAEETTTATAAQEAQKTTTATAAQSSQAEPDSAPDAQNDAPDGQSDPENERGDAPDGPDDDRVAAPNFTVEDANGDPVEFNDLIGKPIVLNFWASWCPPCKSEMPVFNDLSEEFDGSVRFMMVNAVDGSRETKKTGAKYISDNGFTFPVYYDVNQDALAQYGIRAFPTSVFIDADGYIAAGIEGAIDESTLRKGISLIFEAETE